MKLKWLIILFVLLLTTYSSGMLVVSNVDPTKLTKSGDNRDSMVALHQLDVNSIDSAGDVNISGDLAVDTDTFFVDSDNNRVGIGTTSPSTDFHMQVGSYWPGFMLENPDVSGPWNMTFTLKTQSSSTGDPFFKFSRGTAWTWSLGSDTSASDSFKICGYHALGTNDALVIANSLKINIPTALRIGDTTAPTDVLEVNGVTALGDGGTTNYRQIGPNGVLTMHGGARVVKYEWIPASGMSAHVLKSASYTTLANGITSAWEFADNADNAIVYSMLIPKDMDFTAESYICVGWSSPVISGNCYWILEYLMTEEGDDTDGLATDSSGALYATAGIADGMIKDNFITIDANTFDANSLCIHIAITRDVSEDTLGGVAHIHGAVLMYTANKSGEAL